VGVEQTVTIPFLDTLGELDEIAIFMTDIQYVSSPCFLDRINDGDVLVAADLEGQTDLVSQAEGGNQDLQSLLQDMVAFVGPFSTTPFANPVPVSEYLETTNAAIYEWMLFYAAFFNKEDVGNQAVMAAADRCKLLVCTATVFELVQSAYTFFLKTNVLPKMPLVSKRTFPRNQSSCGEVTVVIVEDGTL
jgi:hypothetical protein